MLMKTIITSLSIIILTSSVASAQGHNNPCDKTGKVLVCHLPPGNPENVQMICISENAVAAHLAHGCYVGECDGSDQTRRDFSTYANAVSDFVSVYPNPVEDFLTVEMVFEDVTEAEIAIYDMKGTLVAMPFKGMAESSFIMDCNTDDLATGMYLVRVVTPDKVRTFKISKNN